MTVYYSTRITRALLLSGCLAMALPGLARPESPAAITPSDTHTTIIVPMQDADYASLFARLDSQFNGGQGVLDDNTSGGLAWGQSYLMLSYVRQYKATGDILWLDKLVKQFDRVRTQRDDRLGRVDVHAKVPLKGWGTASYDKAGWHAFVVHNGMICQGPAEFVRLVKETPELQPMYSADAARFLREIEEVVDDAATRYWKTVDGKPDEGYYYDPSMDPMPLNMVAAMASVDLELLAITGKPEYRDRATKFATFFRNCLQENEHGGWNWEYWPKASGQPVKVGEDISHAALNVDFAARCCAAGIVFTKADMEKFATTWLKVVSKGEGQWAGHVDGTKDAGRAYKPQAHGRWLNIVPQLSPETARLMIDDAKAAFAGEPMEFTSRGIGLTNIALYDKKI